MYQIFVFQYQLLPVPLCMFTCLYSVLLWHLESLYHPEFFFNIYIYLIYAVFIRLVLHYVWPFCCPFILVLAAWVLAYRCLLASKGKKKSKNVQIFLYTQKINYFVWKSLSCLFLWFPFPLLRLHLFTFSSDLPASLIERSLFYHFVHHHSSCIFTHFYLCCHPLYPSLC